MFAKVMGYFEGIKMTIVSGIFLGIAAILMFAHIELPLFLNPAWVTVFISGLPLIYLAVERLIYQKWVSSALLITIAMFASIFIGQVFAAGEVVWIMALGALLEDWTVERAKKGLKNLIDLTPQKGRLIVDDSEMMVPVEKIKMDDIIRILPGETIPIDGEIIRGNSSVNQAVITGESLPVDKEVGDDVYCGTMNMYGSIDIRPNSLAKYSSLQKLIDLVRKADEKQAPTQRIADKWATWLVPVALGIAILSWIVTGDIERGVTVLVVFCPCALILATPTAIMAAIGQATKHGILIKSGEALEILGGLNVLAFDKTGTLTYGKLEVSDIISLDDELGEMDILEIAAISEVLSEHPLAKAIIVKAESENLNFSKPEHFKMYPGKGVSAKSDGRDIFAGNLNFILSNKLKMSDSIEDILEEFGKSGKASIIVGLNDKVIGLIGLSDVMREDANEMIENLESLCETVLLTGDHTKTGMYFAEKLGISNVYGDLLPQDKVRIIEEIKKSGKRVCMIGDGVNDAPALKTADVGVAMGSIGSDIAIDAADIALLGDDIEKIPYLKKLSNATLTTIKFNIALSMIINAVAITCSVLGLLNPITGAIVHNVGSCLVVLNAALLYDRKFDKYIKRDLNNNHSVEHNHYHSHDDENHSHSHDNVIILDEIEINGIVKHSHVHSHPLRGKNCDKYHN